MAVSNLESLTRRELATKAKKAGITGWHGMRKAELIAELDKSGLRTTKNKAESVIKPTKQKVKSAARATPKSSKETKTQPKRNSIRRHPGHATRLQNGALQDQMGVTICNPQWVCVQWQLTTPTLNRAKTALGAEYHQAIPVIRIFDVSDREMSSVWVRDVEIQSNDLDHWYIPLEKPQSAYQLHLGYLAPSGKFFTVMRSRKVKMPKANQRNFVFSNSDTLSSKTGSLLNSFKRPFVIRQDKVINKVKQKSNEASTGKNTGKSKSNSNSSSKKTNRNGLHIESGILISGTTHPDAKLTFHGQHVHVEKDGTFALHFDLQDGRQVVPATAVMPDGSESYTVILSMEHHAKELEPRKLDE